MDDCAVDWGCSGFGGIRRLARCCKLAGYQGTLLSAWLLLSFGILETRWANPQMNSCSSGVTGCSASRSKVRPLAASSALELIAGVPETLDYLNRRGHHLIVMTKGNITEQAGKVEHSGRKEYFSAVEVVAEKNAPTYREIVSKYQLAPEMTWMVGNSPKSDINPALPPVSTLSSFPMTIQGSSSMRRSTRAGRLPSARGEQVR